MKQILLVWNGHNETATGTIAEGESGQMIITLTRKPIWAGLEDHIEQLEGILECDENTGMHEGCRDLLKTQISELKAAMDVHKQQEEKYTMRVVVEVVSLKLYKEAYMQLKRINDYVQKDGELTLRNDLSAGKLKALIAEGEKLKL